MTEAYILDAVRTPRGRGRASGGLHEVPSARLAGGLLAALRDRHGLDTSQLNDVILGCVEPVQEQAADIAKSAVFAAGYDQNVPGIQINRFCGSGLEACNFASALIMAGQAELVIGGGVESMSRVPMFSDGGAWITDPQLTIPNRIVPQGISADLIATLYGYSRQDVGCLRVREPAPRGHAWSEGWFFDRSVVPVRDLSWAR
jgi:acetyl-CoA C-acetyltransferase